MQRISWMEKRTNDWVHVASGIEKDETLHQTVLRAKLRFFWTHHAIRWIGKTNDAGVWRGKQKTRKTRGKGEWTRYTKQLE